MSAVILERGASYIIKDLGANRRSWESAPQWIYDGAKYVPFIYSRDDAKKCYRIQTGSIGAVIYDTGVVEMYDPFLTELRVKGENWEIWSAGKAATLTNPITWSMTQTTNNITITRRQGTTKPSGTLQIDYIFNEGHGLKHTVIWTSTGTAAVTIQVKQVHLMDYTKVTTLSGSSTVSKTEKSPQYLFTNGSQEYWMLEDQQSMIYDQSNVEAPTELLTNHCLISGEMDFAGKQVIYTFGDWALTQGQSLTIDPATSTLAGTSVECQLNLSWSTGTYSRNTNQSTALYFRNYVVSSQWGYRVYLEWNTTGIPDTATIGTMKFKYQGYSNTDSGNLGYIRYFNNRNSDYTNDDAGNHSFYTALAAGAGYYSANAFPVVAATQEATLDAGASTDLQGRLAANWYTLALTLTAGSAHKSIYSTAQAGATPKPTLYVEYTVPSAKSSLTSVFSRIMEEEG